MALRTLLWKELRQILLNPMSLAALIIIPVSIVLLSMATASSVSSSGGLLRGKLGLSEPVAVVGSGVDAKLLEEALKAAGLKLVPLSEARVLVYAPRGLAANVSRGEPVRIRVEVKLGKLSMTALQDVLRAPAVIAAAVMEHLYRVSPSKLVHVNVTVVLPTGRVLAGGEAMLITLLNIVVLPLALVVVFAMGPAFSSMVSEYTERMLEMILSQPVPRSRIAVAKAVAASVSGLVQGGVVLAALLYVAYATGFGSLLGRLTGASLASMIPGLTVTVVVETVFASSLALLLAALFPTPESMGMGMALALILALFGVEYLAAAGVPLTQQGLLAVSLVPLTGPLVAVASAVGGLGSVWLAAVAARLAETSVVLAVFTKLLGLERSLAVAGRYRRVIG